MAARGAFKIRYFAIVAFSKTLKYLYLKNGCFHGMFINLIKSKLQLI